jgi:hypothetical protein
MIRNTSHSRLDKQICLSSSSNKASRNIGEESPFKVNNTFNKKQSSITHTTIKLK